MTHEHEQEHASCGGCCCGTENKQKHRLELPPWFAWVRLGICAVLLAVLFFLPENGITALAVGLAATLLAGYEIFWQAIRSLFRRKINEGILMLAAAIACFALGDFREATAIALFFALGEYLEEFASGRSRRSIRALSELRPDTAHIKTSEGLQTVRAESVPVGNEIVVLPHERIPLDGMVIDGSSSVDTSAMTGESLARETMAGDALLSGFINGSGTLTLRTTALVGDSAAARLLELVEHATAQKSDSERLLTRFARIYLPIVIALAALVAIVPALLTGEWGVWIRRGLLVLVSSCPCAIVLSVPLSFFAGIGAAARLGVLVKGGKFIELAAKAEIAVFDKTGTLTTTEFSIREVFPRADSTEEELLHWAAVAEQYSPHPLAKAIIATASGENLIPAEVQEFPGGGVIAEAEGARILCGSKRFLGEQGVDCTALPEAQVYIAKDGQALGCICLESTLHPDAPESVAALRKLGFRRCMMLTGDNEAAAAHAAAACGLDAHFADLLPEQKLERLRELKGNGPLLYVGDGINDAPVLALADVGVAMGLGAQLAAEAADVVLTGTSLRPLARAIALFQKIRRVIAANVVFALAVKAAVLLAGLLLPAPPIWLAVFADVGVMVLTVLNAMRVGKEKMA